MDLKLETHDSKLEAPKSGITIGFVSGNGTTTETSDYNFIDEPIQSGLYSYRLKQIDFDGSFKYSDEVDVNFIFANDFRISQNYPNPFNPCYNN